MSGSGSGATIATGRAHARGPRDVLEVVQAGVVRDDAGEQREHQASASGARWPTMNIIWNSWSLEISIVAVLGLPAHAVRDAALEVRVAGGAQLRGRRAVPAELAEPAHEQRAGGACRGSRAAAPSATARRARGSDSECGDDTRTRAAARPGTSRSARRRRRAGRLVEQILERHAARGVAVGVAHRQLDLDVLGRALVAVLAHVRERASAPGCACGSARRAVRRRAAPAARIRRRAGSRSPSPMLPTV